MDIDAALAFATENHNSVLLTMRRDGRPQSSNVTHWVDDGVVKVSITSDRAKYHNLRREPWAAAHVLKSENFWGYAVLEGRVELTPVAESPDDATVEELVRYYRTLSGEHPDWDDYRATMVRDHRLIARIHPTRAYGAF